MSIEHVVLAAGFLAIPVCVKYFLAFETRSLLENLKEQEEEVRYLSAQWRALERERQVLRRAVNQVASQHRQAQTRRGLIEERLEHLSAGAEEVSEVAWEPLAAAAEA